MSFAGGREVGLIVESLPESLQVKAAVLGVVCAEHPGAILATNTSSISVTALSDAAGAPERTVGTHYWNPPLLMPLVELVAAELTPADLLESGAELLPAIGKRPVRLAREVPGLLWTRLQLAVLRECLWLVDAGVATPETNDEGMGGGPARRRRLAGPLEAAGPGGRGRRWRLTGPFETVGLGGAATFDAIAENLFPVLSNATEGSGFAGHVPTDPQQLRSLRERRDRELAAELRTERGARG